MSKKLTVIGRGTVGCLAVQNFIKFTDWDIDWMYDPSIPTTSVGESSTPFLTVELFDLFGFHTDDLLKMGGTIKYGTDKYNWSTKGDGHFLAPFPITFPGLHFTAVDLQNIAMQEIAKNPRVTIIEGHVDLDSVEDIDSDHVYVCTGLPKKEEDFEVPDAIALNSSLVVDCPWDYPQFNGTITDARPWGWVFGVPLKNRASFGYMYNSDFVDEESVKKDFELTLKSHNVTPGDNFRTYKFKPFYRKDPIGKKVAYGGSAAFFFEPIEATTTTMSIYLYRLALQSWCLGMPVDHANKIYMEMAKHTQAAISTNYLQPPNNYDNEFWRYASGKARGLVENEIANHTKWAQHLRFCKDEFEDRKSHAWFIGMVGSIAYNRIIKNFGLDDYLEGLYQKYGYGKSPVDPDSYDPELFSYDYSKLGREIVIL